MKTGLTLIFCFIFFTALNAQQETKISGKVTDDNNKPIYAANVMIEGSIEGATTDESGYYEFFTKRTGELTLLVVALEFAEQKAIVSLQPGMEIVQDFKMSKEQYRTDEIIVTASSFTSGVNSSVTLTPLEIVRIPGADADLYRAITTFPGSNQVDEGSRIAVRGGDPSEVLTFLDGASLYNPFFFDGVFNTSTYSTINPWGLNGINFTSGGFSAKFGNVLSAVLDLQSFDMPRTTGMFAILGLANAGLSGVYLSNNGKFGASFETGYFYVKPFLELNGSVGEYSPEPTAKNLGGTFSYKLNSTDVLKLYANYNDDRIGIFSESPSYAGFFNSRSSNFFTNLKYKTTLSSVSLLQLSASVSNNRQDIEYGVLDNTSDYLYYKLRGDYSVPVSGDIDLSAGVEYETTREKFNGTVPRYSYNIKPDAPSLELDSEEKSGRMGGYVELRKRVTNNFFSILGARSDYHTFSEKISFDPRLSLVYVFDGRNSLKGATGIYHQYTSLRNYARSKSNDLKPEQAIHYILGYEYNNDGDVIFRTEGFYKNYSDLVSLDQQSGYYVSGGTGFARGVDVFFKFRKRGLFTGWLSYSFVNSKRKQYEATSETSANHDITHNLSVVTTFIIDNYWSTGATFRISTGKPYTPVTHSLFDPGQNVYQPFFEERNSGRFPTYHRIDVNLQRYFTLFNRFVIAFASVNNVFNVYNLFTYTYNADYSERIPVRSTNKRTIYFGFGMQL